MLSEIWSMEYGIDLPITHYNLYFVHIHKSDDQPILTIDISIDTIWYVVGQSRRVTSNSHSLHSKHNIYSRGPYSDTPETEEHVSYMVTE